MKRIMTTLVMAVIMFFAAASANASYTVVKGDSMSKIGKKYNLTWQAVAKANPNVKNPNRIYPKQVLNIPEKAKTTDSSIEDGYTPLNSLGHNPFGAKRDGIKVIGMFSLPEEVKKALIAKVQNGEFELSTKTSIKRGDRFSEMVFGNYKIAKNKIANWENLEAARLYTVEFEGVIYLLYDPLKCRNLTWWSEKKPAEEVIKPPAEAPPVIVESPAPPPTKEPDKPMKMLLVPTEPPKVIVEVKPPKPVAPPILEDKCAMSYESYGWAGHYWALEGGGQSNYYGAKANAFYCFHETSWGKMREGLGVTVNGWDGDNSGYNFRGNRWTIGPVVDLFTKGGSRFTSTIQIGKQKDNGYDGSGYEAGQDTNILYIGQTADFYNINKYIFKTENWVDANIDIGHEKKSAWQGWNIPEANDPAENKTNVSAGSRIYFWQTENLHGGLVAKGTYAFGDHAIGVEAGPFVADKESIIKVGAGFRNQSNSAYETNNGNLLMIGMDLDILKTIDKIVGYLKTKNKEVVK